MPPLTAPPADQFLLVSADCQRRAHWQQLLQQQWPVLTCFHAHDGASALYQVATRPLGLALIDRELPDMAANALEHRALQLQPTLQVLLLLLPLSGPDSDQHQWLWQCLRKYTSANVVLPPP
ncbi:MAG: hypothetical protein ACK4E7_13645 [Permianibacter sp.]